jgi:hypothetical protein
MTSAAPPVTNRASTDRATGPGPSVLRRGLLWAVVLVLAAALGWGIHGLVTRPTARVANPSSWLPKQQLGHPVDQLLVGTSARPALTVVGDTVKVKTPTFSALAEVNGPEVPGEGGPVQPQFVTCTWTVSISHVEGTLPLSVADFDSIDAAQTEFKPGLVPGQRALPAALHTGQRLSFRIRSVMPIGEGLFRWAPDGDHIVAKWDYQVEND